MSLTRRQLLAGCAASCALASCGASGQGSGTSDSGTSDSGAAGSGAAGSGTPGSGGTDSGEPVVDCELVEPGTAEESWVEVSLTEHPQLAEVGGNALIAVPEALLWVLVACTAPDCWVALWSTCTHGACTVEWQAEALQAVCPCHGSVFDADGQVVVGPATAALAAFPVGRSGDSLWVHRPL